MRQYIYREHRGYDTILERLLSPRESMLALDECLLIGRSAPRCPSKTLSKGFLRETLMKYLQSLLGSHLLRGLAGG